MHAMLEGVLAWEVPSWEGSLAWKVLVSVTLCHYQSHTHTDVFVGDKPQTIGLHLHGCRNHISGKQGWKRCKHLVMGGEGDNVVRKFLDLCLLPLLSRPAPVRDIHGGDCNQ